VLSAAQLQPCSACALNGHCIQTVVC
jgi:hypothetical protein